MLEDQKKIMTEIWEEELRRIEAEKATLKDQVRVFIFESPTLNFGLNICLHR